METVFLYFGKRNVMLSLNINHKNKIKYKDYNEKNICEIIKLYCKKNLIYETIILSNRNIYNLEHIYDLYIKIKWNTVNKTFIKYKLINETLYNVGFT